MYEIVQRECRPVAAQPSWPIMGPDLQWSHPSESDGAYGEIANLMLALTVF